MVRMVRSNEISSFHVAIHKDLLIQSIKRDGVDKVLVGIPKRQEEQALKQIEESEQEYYTLSECDNKNADGSCRGHVKE